MSVLEKITIDDSFIKHYWDGHMHICDIRTAYYNNNGEFIEFNYYPIVYALRKLNYNDKNLTQDELNIIKNKVEKTNEKRKIIRQINNLQQELERLNE